MAVAGRLPVHTLCAGLLRHAARTVRLRGLVSARRGLQVCPGLGGLRGVLLPGPAGRAPDPAVLLVLPHHAGGPQPALRAAGRGRALRRRGERRRRSDRRGGRRQRAVGAEGRPRRLLRRRALGDGARRARGGGLGQPGAVQGAPRAGARHAPRQPGHRPGGRPERRGGPQAHEGLPERGAQHGDGPVCLRHLLHRLLHLQLVHPPDARRAGRPHVHEADQGSAHEAGAVCDGGSLLLQLHIHRPLRRAVAGVGVAERSVVDGLRRRRPRGHARGPALLLHHVHRALLPGHNLGPHRAEAKGLRRDAGAPRCDRGCHLHLLRLRVEPRGCGRDGPARSGGRPAAHGQGVQVHSRSDEAAPLAVLGRSPLRDLRHRLLRHAARPLRIRLLVCPHGGLALLSEGHPGVDLRRPAVHPALLAGLLVLPHHQGRRAPPVRTERGGPAIRR
mmetsp:Transcript_57832/g.152194  ORF Transcript_57832/g.152194 Transcript_57832/m.152194 type:complete len:446 (+) Transcript_57832:738-2075(+)